MSVILPPAMQHEAMSIRNALDVAVRCLAEGDAQQAGAILINISTRAEALGNALRQPKTRDYASTVPAPKRGK